MACREADCECEKYIPHQWKKGSCSDCFHPKDSHVSPSSPSPPAAATSHTRRLTGFDGVMKPPEKVAPAVPNKPVQPTPFRPPARGPPSVPVEPTPPTTSKPSMSIAPAPTPTVPDRDLMNLPKPAPAPGLAKDLPGRPPPSAPSPGSGAPPETILPQKLPPRPHSPLPSRPPPRLPSQQQPPLPSRPPPSSGLPSRAPPGPPPQDDAAEKEKQRLAKANAEAERLRLEAAEKEKQRLAAEAEAAEGTRLRLEAAEKERQRLADEAEAERLRLEAAEKEKQRLADEAEAAAQAERLRLEAAEKEKQRLAAEAEAAAEAERRLEAAEKEKQRLADEAAQQPSEAITSALAELDALGGDEPLGVPEPQTARAEIVPLVGADLTSEPGPASVPPVQAAPTSEATIAPADGQLAEAAPPARPLTLADVLSDESLLSAFDQFLLSEPFAAEGLHFLHFLLATWEYSHASTVEERMTLANGIYDVHFVNVNLPEEIINSVVECEELGPDTFKRAQDFVYVQLEATWLPLFQQAVLGTDSAATGAMTDENQTQAIEEVEWFINNSLELVQFLESENLLPYLQFHRAVERIETLTDENERLDLANDLFFCYMSPDAIYPLQFPDEVWQNTVMSAPLTPKTFELARQYTFSVLTEQLNRFFYSPFFSGGAATTLPPGSPKAGAPLPVRAEAGGISPDKSGAAKSSPQRSVSGASASPTASPGRFPSPTAPLPRPPEGGRDHTPSPGKQRPDPPTKERPDADSVKGVMDVAAGGPHRDQTPVSMGSASSPLKSNSTSPSRPHPSPPGVRAPQMPPSAGVNQVSPSPSSPFKERLGVSPARSAPSPPGSASVTMSSRASSRGSVRGVSPGAVRVLPVPGTESPVGAVGAPKPKPPSGPPPPTAKRSREAIISDILDSEREFVEQMEVFMAGFHGPLKGAQPPILPDSVVSTLFDHIAPSLNFHQMLLRELDSSGANQTGKTFCNFADYFKIYRNYCNNYGMATKTMLRLLEEDSRRKKPELAPFWQKCTVSCGDRLKHDPIELLAKPLQRVEAYPQLLRQLLEATPADDPDLEPLKLAIGKMEDLASLIKESEAQFENTQEVLDIQRTMEGAGDLVTPTRRLLRKGPVMKVAHRGRNIPGFMKKKQKGDDVSTDDYQMFLFNDCIILAKASGIGAKLLTQGKKYHFKAQLSLRHTSLKELENTPQMKNAFELVDKTANKSQHVILCATPDDKDVWMETIADAREEIQSGANRPAAAIAPPTSHLGGGMSPTPDQRKKHSKYGDILIKMQDVENGIHLDTHKVLLKTYSRCFSGSDATEWMETYLEIGSRDEVVSLMTELLDDGIVESLTHSHTNFKADPQCLYRFVESGQEKDARLKRKKANTELGRRAGREDSLATPMGDDEQSKAQQLRNLVHGPRTIKEQIELAVLEERAFLTEELVRLEEKYGNDSKEFLAVQSIFDLIQRKIEGL